MVKVIKIDEELVNEIQAKDIEAQTSKDIIMQLIDMHNLDTDTSLIDSPVFKKYEEESKKKILAFDKLKDKMFMENCPKELIPKVKEWNLNYFTCDLSISY